MRRPHRRRHLDRRHDQQALRPRRRFADHRRRHVGRRALRRVRHRLGRVLHPPAAAHDICARVAYRGDTLAAAAEEVVDGRRSRGSAATAARSRSTPTATSRCRSTRRACTAAGSGRTARAERRFSATHDFATHEKTGPAAGFSGPLACSAFLRQHQVRVDRLVVVAMARRQFLQYRKQCDRQHRATGSEEAELVEQARVDRQDCNGSVMFSGTLA